MRLFRGLGVMFLGCLLASVSGNVACSSDPVVEPPVAKGTTAVLDPSADFAKEGAFFDVPYPSDARLDAKGGPDIAAYPNPALPIIDEFKKIAGQRKGFPVMSIGYFRFDAPLEPRTESGVLPGDKAQPILLIDVDDKSPEKGRLFPVVASTPNPDGYVPEYLLTVAARPGVLLSPSRKYAFVVRASAKDAAGNALVASAAMQKLAKGESPGGTRGDALVPLYAPLFAALDAAGIPRTDVVAATVFTTGDVVAETAALTKKLSEAAPATLKDYALETIPSLQSASFCHVTAKITLPQFQKGKPPFDTEGLFDFGADGLPVKQRDEDVSVSITIPKREMPAAGFPLVVFFHGSGGLARELVDGGTKGDPFEVWPGATMANLGFAMAGASLPISPERVPGAKDYDYLNLNNTPAMRDTFRQGIVESRILITALEKARIPKAVLDACTGVSLPATETEYKLDLERLSVQGQSMGGMYTNMVGAVEPRIEAAVPTGAGGYWTYFALRTEVLPNSYNLLRLLIGTREEITFMHPALHLIETAWEAIDPITSTPRLSREPLPGHPVRSVYEPVGKGDSYFNTDIYDAMALAYGHPRAGDDIWPTMKSSLDLVGLGEKATYPVKSNLKTVDGKPYTGVVVQYDNDNGAFDGHGIYRRVEAVRYQYGCFHATYRKNGVAVVPPPAKLGTPCPE